MNTPASTPTNETVTDKESALAKFLKTLDPKAKPNKSDQKAAAAKFRGFQAKRKAALQALKDLEGEEQEVSRAMLAAYGKQKITLDGVDFVPTSRDERIYYKEMSGKGVEI